MVIWTFLQPLQMWHFCFCSIFAEHSNFHAHTSTPLWQEVAVSHRLWICGLPSMYRPTPGRGAALTRVLSSAPCTGPARSRRTGCSPPSPRSPCPLWRACSRTAAAASPGRSTPSHPPRRSSRTHWTRAPVERESVGRRHARCLHACIHGWQ